VTGWSLRSRLLIVGRAAIIPALGLLAVIAREEQRTATQEAKEAALRLAQDASWDQESAIEGARQLPVGLAALGVVRRGDTEGCNAVAATLIERFPPVDADQLLQVFTTG
jgi:hypothetical protein